MADSSDFYSDFWPRNVGSGTEGSERRNWSGTTHLSAAASYLASRMEIVSLHEPAQLLALMRQNPRSTHYWSSVSHREAMSHSRCQRLSPYVPCLQQCVRKSLYEALSVPGYAPPHSNSMRGMFFCFPLFCPFAATKGVLGRCGVCHKPFIISRLRRTQPLPSGPKPSRLSVGKSVGKHGESPRVRSLFPTSHRCLLSVRSGSENVATHRCYSAVLPCFPARRCPLG